MASPTHPLTRGPFILTVALFAAASAHAQAQPAPNPTVATLLDRIVANAAHYRATLPSLTADESIESSNHVGIFSRSEKATASFRVLRDPGRDDLKESRQLLTVNKKPIAPGKEHNLPMTFYGAFGGFEDVFFLPRNLPCFDFTLAPQPTPDAPLELHFTARPASWTTNAACAAHPYEVTGLARVDPATAQILHLERSVPTEYANNHQLADFVSVDVAPTTVGTDTFWLPTRIVGEHDHGRARFTAQYGSYRRFAGSLKILTDTVAPTPEQKPQ